MSPTTLDPSAPVLGTAALAIDASPEVVWEVLTAFRDWPSWNPEVKSLTLTGDGSVGSSFRWKAGPGTISSKVVESEAPHLIAWTGATLGIKAQHVYRLEARDGGTFVSTEETYAGLVAKLFRGSLQKTLDRALADGLAALKAEVERRARPSKVA